MTKSTLFDRLNQELEAFGKKAQAALDEGKLQIELLRVRRRKDNTARDLGLLVHRRERGGNVEPGRIDVLMARLDDLQAEIARLELQISQARRKNPPAATSVVDTSATAAAGTDRTDDPTAG